MIKIISFFQLALIVILFGSVTSQSMEFMNLKKRLMIKVMEDLKEKASIRCFHYIIDSASNTNVMTDLSISFKIVDHRAMRSNKIVMNTRK